MGGKGSVRSACIPDIRRAVCVHSSIGNVVLVHRHVSNVVIGESVLALQVGDENTFALDAEGGGEPLLSKKAPGEHVRDCSALRTAVAVLREVNLLDVAIAGGFVCESSLAVGADVRLLARAKLKGQSKLQRQIEWIRTGRSRGSSRHTVV